MRFIKENYGYLLIILLCIGLGVFILFSNSSTKQPVNTEFSSSGAITIANVGIDVLDNTVVNYSISSELLNECKNDDCFMMIRLHDDDKTEDVGPILNKEVITSTGQLTISVKDNPDFVNASLVMILVNRELEIESLKFER